MNQNQWQKDYIGRRDPKVIREENANRVFEQRMTKTSTRTKTSELY